MNRKLFTSMLAVFTVFCASAAGKMPAIHMAGDSTMCDYKDTRRGGWGQLLKQQVKPGVVVNNRAVGGQSTKSFIESKRWSKLLAKVKKGDYIIIQFGHNDQKKKNADRYAAADGDFKTNLTKFITEAKNKGAKPILATSVCRRTYGKDGKLTDAPKLKLYADATMAVAKEMNVPVVDLNTITRDYLNEIGKEKSLELFFILYDKKDNTHTTIKGGEIFAKMFVDDTKKQNLDIAKLFK